MTIPLAHGDPTTNDQLNLDLPDLPPPRKKSASTADKAAHDDRNLESHPQTRAKLDAFRRYVPHFLGKLGNLESHVFVLDLLGGSGRVRDGLGWADGSPLVACRAAEEATADFARRGRDVMFSLRFVEPNDEARTTLNRLVGPFRSALDIRVSPGKAAGHIASLLAESSASPTITFLDPDGFGVTFDQVIAFGDRAYSEVLLNFDVQGLLRTAGIVQTRSVTNFCGGGVRVVWHAGIGVMTAAHQRSSADVSARRIDAPRSSRRWAPWSSDWSKDVRLGHRPEQGGPVVFALDRLRALAQERGDRLVAGLLAQPDDAGLEAFIRPIGGRIGGIRSGLRRSLSLLGTGERLHGAVAYDTGRSLRRPSRRASGSRAPPRRRDRRR